MSSTATFLLRFCQHSSFERRHRHFFFPFFSSTRLSTVTPAAEITFAVSGSPFFFSSLRCGGGGRDARHITFTNATAHRSTQLCSVVVYFGKKGFLTAFLLWRMFAQLCRVGPSKEDYHKIIKHTQTRIGFVIFQALAVAQSFLILLKCFI